MDSNAQVEWVCKAARQMSPLTKGMQCKLAYRIGNSFVKGHQSLAGDTTASSHCQVEPLLIKKEP